MNSADFGVLQWVWGNTEHYLNVIFELVMIVIMKSSILFDVTKCILMDR